MRIETSKKKARIPIWSVAQYLRLYSMVEEALGAHHADMSDELVWVETIVQATREAVRHLEHLAGERRAPVSSSTVGVAAREIEQAYDYVTQPGGLDDVCDILGIDADVVREDIRKIFRVARSSDGGAKLAERYYYLKDLEAHNPDRYRLLALIGQAEVSDG